MQYVPLHLAQELWNATPERTWPALKDRFQEYLEDKGKVEGVNPTTLFQVLHNLAHRGAIYPDSPKELHRILNEEVDAITD